MCARACMCVHVLKQKNKNKNCWLSSPFYNHLTKFNNRSPVFYFNNTPVTDWLWPPFKHTYIAAGHARTRTESSPWQEEDIYIIWYRHLQWFLQFLLHKIWWPMKNSLLCHPNYIYMHQNFNKISNLTTVVVFQNHSSTSRHVNCSSFVFNFKSNFWQNVGLDVELLENNVECHCGPNGYPQLWSSSLCDGSIQLSCLSDNVLCYNIRGDLATARLLWTNGQKCYKVAQYG